MKRRGERTQGSGGTYRTPRSRSQQTSPLLRWSLENERGHERTRAPSANGKEIDPSRWQRTYGVDLRGQVKLETIQRSSWRWYRGTRGEGMEPVELGHLPRRRLQRDDAEAGRP